MQVKIALNSFSNYAFISTNNLFGFKYQMVNTNFRKHQKSESNLETIHLKSKQESTSTFQDYVKAYFKENSKLCLNSSNERNALKAIKTDV